MKAEGLRVQVNKALVSRGITKSRVIGTARQIVSGFCDMSAICRDSLYRLFFSDGLFTGRHYSRSLRLQMFIDVNELSQLWTDAINSKRYAEAFELSAEIFSLSHSRDSSYVDANLDQWERLFSSRFFREFKTDLSSLVSNEAAFCMSLLLVLRLRDMVLVQKLLDKHYARYKRLPRTRKIVELVWALGVVRPLEYYKSGGTDALDDWLQPEDVVGKRVLVLGYGTVDVNPLARYVRNADMSICLVDGPSRSKVINLDDSLGIRVFSLLSLFTVSENGRGKTMHSLLEGVQKIINVAWQESCKCIGECQVAFLREIFETYSQDILSGVYRMISCLELLLSQEEYDHILIIDESGHSVKNVLGIIEKRAKSPVWIMASSLNNYCQLQDSLQKSSDPLTYQIETFVVPRLFSKNQRYRKAAAAGDALPSDWLDEFRSQVEKMRRSCVVDLDLEHPYIFLPLCLTSSRDKLGYDALSLLRAALSKSNVVVLPNITKAQIETRNPEWIQEWNELVSHPNCSVMEHERHLFPKKLAGCIYVNVLRAVKEQGLEDAYGGSIEVSKLFYKILLVWFSDLMPLCYKLQNLYEKRLPMYVVGCFHRMFIVKMAFELAKERGVKSVSAIPLLAAPGDIRQSESTLSGDFYSMIDSSQRKQMIEAYSLDSARVIQGGGRRYDDARRVKVTPSAEHAKVLEAMSEEGVLFSYFPQHSLGLTVNRSLDLLLRCCNELPEMRLVVKPHPAESAAQKKYYRDACEAADLDGRCVCMVGRIDPLVVVDYSDVVCTHCSNIGIEAVLRGQVVLTLHPGNERWMYDLADMGVAYAARSEEEIISTVSSLVRDPSFLGKLRSLSGKYLDENPQFTDSLTYGERIINFMDGVVV